MFVACLPCTDDKDVNRVEDGGDTSRDNENSIPNVGSLSRKGKALQVTSYQTHNGNNSQYGMQCANLLIGSGQLLLLSEGFYDSRFPSCLCHSQFSI